jgi:hypothetical protein
MGKPIKHHTTELNPWLGVRSISRNAHMGEDIGRFEEIFGRGDAP